MAELRTALILVVEAQGGGSFPHRGVLDAHTSRAKPLSQAGGSSYKRHAGWSRRAGMPSSRRPSASGWCSSSLPQQPRAPTLLYIYRGAAAVVLRNIGRDRASARKIGPCAAADPRIASVVEASALRASSSSACAWGEKNRISVTGCRRSVARGLGLFHTYTEVSSGVLAAGNGSIGRSLSGAVVAPARCTTWSLHPSCWYLSTQLNRSAVVSVIDQFHT